MKRTSLLALVTTLIALAGAAGWWIGHATGAVDKGAAEPAPSVLINSEIVQQQMLPMTLSVFGEVVGGKAQALSFAQAGQLARLAVVAGQRVRRNELIALLSADPTVQSSYAQAVNGLAFAQRELRRIEDLLALQLATQSQLDGAARQLADARDVLAAQTKLGAALATTRLLAPFDAIVMALPVAQGERVAPGAVIVQLAPTDSMRVQLAIEPGQRGALKAGMPLMLTALHDDAPAIAASITELATMVDPKTQMVGAIVALAPTKQANLLIGMHVQAQIALGARQAWSVPRLAVLTDEQGAYLFQVAKGHAQRVAVKVLLETGQRVGVDGKLDARLPVVVLGNYELQHGMAVREGPR